jgi:hypothetical protein
MPHNNTDRKGKKNNVKTPATKVGMTAVKAALKFKRLTFEDPISLQRVGRSRGIMLNTKLYNLDSLKELLKRNPHAKVPHSRQPIPNEARAIIHRHTPTGAGVQEVVQCLRQALKVRPVTANNMFYFSGPKEVYFGHYVEMSVEEPENEYCHIDYTFRAREQSRIETVLTGEIERKGFAVHGQTVHVASAHEPGLARAQWALDLIKEGLKSQFGRQVAVIPVRGTWWESSKGSNRTDRMVQKYSNKFPGHTLLFFEK